MTSRESTIAATAMASSRRSFLTKSLRLSRRRSRRNRARLTTAGLDVPACLADEEYRLEEDSVEEVRRREVQENLRKQLEVQEREEAKRKREQRM